MKKLIALVWLLFALPALATDPVRIMHPAYRTGHTSFGDRNIWSRDGKRIMMYETEAEYTTVYGAKTGRGLVWGYVDDCGSHNCLTEWTTVGEYETYATPLPDQVHISRRPFSAYWSPIVGEESIIYAPFYSGDSCSALKKIDVEAETPAWADVISIDDSETCTFGCIGWDASNRLVCQRTNDSWTAGGYYITVTGTPSKAAIAPNVFYYNNIAYTCYPSTPGYPYTVDEEWTLPDFGGHGHGGKSPGRIYAGNNYGNGTYPGVLNTKGIIKRTNSVCQAVPDSVGTNNHSTHMSWKASDNWFITGTCGDSCTFHDAPFIETFRLYKANFDGSNFSYTELLSRTGAGRWESSPGAADHGNFEAEPIPTLRADGLQLVFNSTDGKYTIDDYNADESATPWGLEGVFLWTLPGYIYNDNPPVDITFQWNSPSQPTWYTRVYERFGTPGSYTYSSIIVDAPANNATVTALAYPAGTHTFIARNFDGTLESVDSDAVTGVFTSEDPEATDTTSPVITITAPTTGGAGVTDAFGAATEQDIATGGDGAKSYSWNVLNSANADAIDVHTTNAGKLTINNDATASDFDAGTFTGPFVYKTITGDFDVETYANPAALGRYYEQFNLIVRDPAASAGEDYVYICPLYWGSVYLQVGNVTNNVSTNSQTWSSTTHPYLRITRSGNVLTLYSKAASGDGWTERAEWTRSDFASAVQVGIGTATANTSDLLTVQFDYFTDNLGGESAVPDIYAAVGTPLTTLAGTASDAVGVTSVTWSSSRGPSGTATGTTSWSIASIALSNGTNVITITAHDDAGNTASKDITVTYSGASVDMPLKLRMTGGALMPK